MGVSRQPAGCATACLQAVRSCEGRTACKQAVAQRTVQRAFGESAHLAEIRRNITVRCTVGVAILMALTTVVLAAVRGAENEKDVLNYAAQKAAPKDIKKIV